DDDMVDPHLAQPTESVRERLDARDRVAGSKDVTRGGIEREHARRTPRLARTLHQQVEQVAMPAVDPVEVPHGEDGSGRWVRVARGPLEHFRVCSHLTPAETEPIMLLPTPVQAP